MRCGECEAAGLVEPCFCPCCGRPLTSVGAHDAHDHHAAATHPCASCGAPAPAAQELCDRCEAAFQRVLQASAPPAPAGVPADLPTDADTPTIITSRDLVGLPATLSTTASATAPVPDPPCEPLAPVPVTVADEDRACADEPPEDAPKPWWELSVPATVTAPSPEPVAEAPPHVAMTTSSSTLAELALATEAPAAAEAPPSRHVAAVAEPIARPRRPPAAVPRARVAPRRSSLGRAATIAVSASALCIAALVGAPHAFDLVWSAPAPVQTAVEAPPLPTPTDTPLPDTSALVPEVDPSEAPPPQAAASTAATPTASAQAKPAPRGATRADTAAARRAARLLQQRSAAQASPAAAPAPAVTMPALPLPAMEPAPALVTPPQAAPVAEDLGQAFEVTQVDVRPQVLRQVPPRRPDTATTADVVVVRVLVSPAGRAADVRVVRSARGAAAYDRAAVEAVRQWSFSPAQKRSRAVSCWVHVGVPFAE